MDHNTRLTYLVSATSCRLCPSTLVFPSEMVETRAQQAKNRVVSSRRMKRCQLEAGMKHSLKVHLIWIPKYGKKFLTGQGATLGV
jgi:hypothetical protein